MDLLLVHDGRIDLVTGTGHGPTGPVTLTERERTLLRFLVDRPGVDVPRDTLLTEVWGYSDRTLSRAVDSTVHRLRDKIEHDPAHPRHLLTVFGTGYRFVPLPSGEQAVGARIAPRRVLALGDRSVDLDQRVVRDGDAEVGLTPVDVALLEVLIAAAGRLVDRAGMIGAAAGRVGRRTLDSAIHRLRAKIEADPAQPRYLLTCRGAGYRLALDEPRARVHTLVQIGLWQERDRWHADPTGTADQVVALLGWLDRTSRANGGVATGDGWRHVFSALDAGLRWVTTVQSDPERRGSLVAAIHQGRPAVWTDPVTGRVACEGPPVHRLLDLVTRCPPGAIVADPGLAPALRASGADPVDHGPGVIVLGGDRPTGPTAGAALPWVHDPFFGRATELAAVGGLVDAGPGLVTLVGPGGVGKSRLALEVCARRTRPGGIHALSIAELR
ncbi:MAG: winged helix-turn-helix domain-containing protein, partial [Myxococcota bacterium]